MPCFALSSAASSSLSSTNWPNLRQPDGLSSGSRISFSSSGILASASWTSGLLLDRGGGGRGIGAGPGPCMPCFSGVLSRWLRNDCWSEARLKSVLAVSAVKIRAYEIYSCRGHEVSGIGRRIQTTSSSFRSDTDFRAGCMESRAFESHKQPERRVLLHTVGHKNAAATMKVDIDSATRHNGDPGADVWLHDWLLLGTSS